MESNHDRKDMGIFAQDRDISFRIIIIALTILLLTGLCSGAALTADQWNDKGVDLFDNQSYKEALDAFEKATGVDPDNELAWYNTGLVLFNLGRYNDSVLAYRNAIDINPVSADTWYNLGMVLEQTGNSSESEEAFARSAELEETQYKESEPDEAVQDVSEEEQAGYEDSSPGSTGTGDAEFDRLYQKNEPKITEALHQITTWLTDKNWGETDKKALKTSKFLVEYMNELKALELSGKYEEKRDSYVFFLEQIATATNEISEIASLYQVYFNHGNVNFYSKGDEEDYYNRLESAITSISSARDELDRFNKKYSS